MPTPYGWISHSDGKRIKGWIAAPQDIPLAVELLVNGELLGEYGASTKRPDVEKLVHTGWVGAGFTIPTEFDTPALIEVRCATTHTELNGSPFLFSSTPRVSLEQLSRLPYFQQRLSYSADLVRDFLLQLGVARSALESVNTDYDIELAPLYSCKKQLTGLVWCFPTLDKKLVQLNKQKKDVECIERLHQYLDAQNNRERYFRVPRLLGATPFNALFYEHVDALDSVEEGQEVAFRISMIRALLELGTLKDKTLKPRLALRLKQALGDVRRVLYQKVDNITERFFHLTLIARYWRLPQVFSHGDAHRDNWLIEKKNHDLYLIDWSHYGYLPWGYDLACLLNDQPLDKAISLLREACEPLEHINTEKVVTSVLLNLFYIRHVKGSHSQKEKHALLERLRG